MGCFARGGKNGMGCFVWGDKTAWDVMSGVTKTAWDVFPGWQIFVECFVQGGKKWHGMFCSLMFCQAPHFTSD